MSIIVTKNDTEGLQVEWEDVLLTMTPNEHHGISGSLAINGKDGKVRLMNFHGQSWKIPFPMELHEEELPDKESGA